ncbi:MAG: peptidoglycan D,D-transpeptidase FtsI family protein [Microcystaceae cyanobacterium]
MTDARFKFSSSRPRSRSSRSSVKRPSSKKKPLRGRKIRKKQKITPLPKFRLILVWAVLAMSVLGLGWKAYQLQVVQAEELKKRARSQQMTTLRPFIPRRTIIDRNDNVVAVDRVVYTLYVHPKLFKQSKEDIAAKVAPLLKEKTASALIERFNQQASGIRIAYGLTEAEAKALRSLSLDGLELIEHYARVYPHEKVMAGIVGYVDQDRNPQAGIERSQNKLLEREKTRLTIRRSGNGMIMPAELPKNILKSNDWRLELTLDLRLQRAARTALKQQLAKFKAKRGAVIVMDATDGSLLALVSEPTYNPNEYHRYDIGLFKNWAVSDLYEPGSTFKPINVALALEAGAIQANSSIYDSGSVTVDGWPIGNASKTGYGSLSIARIMQTSSNVAMVHMMRRLTKKDYYSRLQELGLGEKVGIDLPGEVAGHLKSEKIFTERNIEVATTSFGQGFSLTPIQLVQLHGALANGGKLVVPHVTKGLVDGEGNVHWQADHEVKQVFSPENSLKVVQMMETVVSQGTGKPAKIANYRIGGKTGTAQKAGPRGGYLPNAKITSFVSILPVNNPRYVVLAVVDEPQGSNTYGSTVAAPIAKQVMESLISLQGIPPSTTGE